ncbi:hypothetical protein, partial [Klebsiella variicola]|uniref:hypothetical protein n=1 Tax=Klebsiella variicola TaxID=244366 RepID=UPI0039C265FC
HIKTIPDILRDSYTIIEVYIIRDIHTFNAPKSEPPEDKLKTKPTNTTLKINNKQTTHTTENYTPNTYIQSS